MNGSMTTFSFRALFATLAASTFCVSTVQSQSVSISLQPAYHGIPIYAAQEFGWFEEAGLNVTISFYSSGAPQIAAAVENSTWDMGILGSVPAVLGGAQGIVTVGINNDESAVTEIVGARRVTEWPPSELSEGIFGATASSTGELLLLECLLAAGINFTADNIQYGSQAELVTLLEDEEISYASLWSPNTYAYREANRNSEVFCNGADLDFPILGGIVVRDEWAQADPSLVARVLAVYLKAVGFMQNKENLDAVIELSRDFYEFAGVPQVSNEALESDIMLRPLFNLDQQLGLMNRNLDNRGISKLDEHYSELERFLNAFDANAVDQNPGPREYIDDTYMKLVSEDPVLREMAYEELSADAPVEDAAESVDVTISIQPGFLGIPVFAAQEFGWFAELGINADVVLYPAGNPQIADAVDNSTWDFGILGSVPALIGGGQGIWTIGVSNDASAAHQVVGAPGINEWPPTTLEMGTFGATSSSTGELLMLECLVAAGVNFTANNIQYGSQDELQQLLADNAVSYASLWSPNTHSYLQSQESAEVFCSGSDINLPVFNVLAVREDWAFDDPTLAARVLSVYLRAVGYMLNHENLDKAVDLSRAFYYSIGAPPISDDALRSDLLYRPMFNLDQQMELMDRNFVDGGVSQLDAHFNQLQTVLSFFDDTEEVGNPNEYITDEFLRLVSEDPTLRNFAYQELSTVSNETVPVSPTMAPETPAPEPTAGVPTEPGAAPSGAPGPTDAPAPTDAPGPSEPTEVPASTEPPASAARMIAGRVATALVIPLGSLSLYLF